MPELANLFSGYLAEFCPVCLASAGEPCRYDNGQPGPGFVHAGRVSGGGPLRVKHTGQYNSDGGAILEIVEETKS